MLEVITSLRRPWGGKCRGVECYVDQCRSVTLGRSSSRIEIEKELRVCREFVVGKEKKICLCGKSNENGEERCHIVIHPTR